jgi:putative DNA primase/helicase
MTDAEQFVAHVFGEHFPPGLRVELYSLKGAYKGASSLGTPSAANAIAAGSPVDTYVTVAYQREKPPKGKRATAATAAGIPALWIDLDVNGGPDNKTGAFASKEAAIEAANSVRPPTLVVDSGYGIHAWWVFDEPWIFADDLDRQRAARLAQAWQDAHRKKNPSVKIDSTHDLARLMRLPGTRNGK